MPSEWQLMQGSVSTVYRYIANVKIYPPANLTRASDFMCSGSSMPATVHRSLTTLALFSCMQDTS